VSRRTVRASVVQFFTSPPVPGLPVVRPALEPQDQLAAEGTYLPAQTLGVVYMPAGQDRRLSTPAKTSAVGVAGIKLIPHDVHLQVCHFFPGSGEDAMADCDDTLESILTRLRSEARLGQDPSAIFEVEQGDGRIRWRVGETVFLNEGDAALTWFAVMFTVVEQIQA